MGKSEMNASIMAPTLQAEDIWGAWISNFASWEKQTLQLDWLGPNHTDGWWTHNVVNQFMEVLAQKLNLTLAMNEPAARNKRKDFVLIDSQSKKVAHLEHENNFDQLLGELSKLRHSEPTIKCAISYGTLEEIDDQMN